MLASSKIVAVKEKSSSAFRASYLLTNYRIQIQINSERDGNFDRVGDMVPVSFDLAAIFRPIRSRSSLFLLLFFLFLYSICLVSFLFLCVVVVVNLTTLINNDRKMSCSSFFFSKILLFLCTSVLQEDDVDSWGDVGVCVSSGVFIPYV